MSPSPVSVPESVDSAAFVAEVRPALVKYFQRKCRSVSEAEDLAQDVIVRSLAHAGWTSADHARGYVFRAAVNRWRDRERRRVTHGTVLQWNDQAAFSRDEGFLPERVLGIEQELQHVVAALSKLNERSRDVFILARLERMRRAEIAAIFGISVSAVEKHLAKALAHIARSVRR